MITKRTEMAEESLASFREQAEHLGIGDDVPEDGEWHMVDFNKSVKARRREVTHEMLEADIAGFQSHLRFLNPPTRKQIEEELDVWDFSPPPKECMDFSVISACYFRIMSYRDRLGELISIVGAADNITQDAQKSFTETAMALTSGVVAEKKANALQRVRSIERAAGHTKSMLSLLTEKDKSLKVMLDTMSNSLRYLESLLRSSRWQSEGQSNHYSSNLGADYPQSDTGGRFTSGENRTTTHVRKSY